MVRLILTYIALSVTTLMMAQDISIRPVKTKLLGNVYGPTYYRDHIVVCSDQRSGIVKTVLDQSGTITTNLYELLDTNGNYEPFNERMKSDYNDGPGSFDANGGYLVFSRNVYSKRSLIKFQDDNNPMGLFWSAFTNVGWSHPELLPFIDTSYNYMHPGLNEKGDKLVFASNCAGGFGGYDIWISYFNGDRWGTPVNAGPNINTKNNELFPSIAERSIYFSSDKKGVGGLDIYAFDTLSKMTTALEKPINSVFDDFGFICKNNMTEGYFTSNRNSKDEIWSFNMDRPDEIPCDTLVSNNLCYELTEQNAAEMGGDSEHLIFVWNINGEQKKGITIDYCFPGEGGYEITLDIIDTIVNQTFFNQSYYYLEIRYEEQPYITSPDTVLRDEKFKLSSDETNLPGAEILGYEWSISDGTKKTEKNITHLFESEGQYIVELILEVKQDDSVYYECVYKGITCLTKKVDPAIINRENVLDDTAAVKDETQFFAEGNDSSKVVYSIEVIRTKEKLDNDNFLFELMESYGDVKIHYIEEEQEYSYLIGEWESIEEAHPTWRTLLEDGYDEAIVRSVDLESISNFSLDNSFELDNVTFDEGAWQVKPKAIPDLENIIEIMLVFPDIKLKVEAHTNSNGDSEENLQLSIKRAEAVKGYIISKGVDPSRITAEGFGETKPKMSNDTPEGLKANRRVEFTFIK